MALSLPGTMGRMFKKRRLFLMILGGLLVLLIGGAFLLVRFGGQMAVSEAEDAAVFGDNTLAEIAYEWSPEVLNFYASPELLTDGEGEARKTKMANLRREFGPYVSGHGIVTGLRAEKDLNGDDALVGDYSVEAQFKEAKAVVEMKLMKRKVGDWMIMTFKVAKLDGKEKK